MVFLPTTKINLYKCSLLDVMYEMQLMKCKQNPRFLYEIPSNIINYKALLAHAFVFFVSRSCFLFSLHCGTSRYRAWYAVCTLVVVAHLHSILFIFIFCAIIINLKVIYAWGHSILQLCVLHTHTHTQMMMMMMLFPIDWDERVVNQSRIQISGWLIAHVR